MMTKKEQRLRRSRQTRVRIAIQRVARLTVFRSNLHIYAKSSRKMAARCWLQPPRPRSRSANS